MGWSFQAPSLRASFSDPLGATDLQIAAASYDRQVDELVSSDPSLAEYAQQILDDEAEEAAEQISEMVENPDALMDELEQFLRQQDE